jgi:hypothetical protein
MRARGSRRLVGACVGVLALAVVTGCQSSAEEPSDPTSSATSSPSTPSPSSPAPTSTPVVEPADGKLVKVPGASMRALPTYERNSDFGIVQGYRDGQSSLTLSPSLTMAPSLDAYAREWIREHGGRQVQVRQDDAVAGGKYSAWHVVDTTSDPTQRVHTFGTMFLDSAWLIIIRINLEGVPETLTEEEEQGVIDSLLASFKTDLD